LTENTGKQLDYPKITFGLTAECETSKVIGAKREALNKQLARLKKPHPCMTQGGESLTTHVMEAST